MDSPIGTRVGHFRVVDLLHKGGMGEVYVGYDEKLERKVALKMIRAEHRLDAESKARFLREARVLSQLAHPNICQIFEYIEGNEADVLALELIHGTRLSDVIPKRTDLRWKLGLAIELGEALAAAHGKGIVHRDLKPDNVMVDDRGRARVLDFGMSRSTADDQTIPAALANRQAASLPPDGDVMTGSPRLAEAENSQDPSMFHTRFGSILGTLSYMSPEQARGEPATTASDVYCLGLVLQELLTGERAFSPDGSVPERLERAAKGESRPVKGLDPDLTKLIEQMKSLAPATRPTALESVDRLRWIRAKPARRRRRYLAVAALVALVAFSIGATIQAVLISKERNRANQERDRANEEAERAREMLAFLTGTFEVANPRKGRGPTATAKEIIDHAATKLGEANGQPLLRASLLAVLSEIYSEMGLYDLAEPMARRALEIREKALDPAHLDLAAILATLGNIRRKQGMPAEAEALTRRSLEIRERALGPDHLDVAQSLNDLAIVRWNQGELADAEPLLKRSLLIREKAFGPEHALVATSLNNLATLYVDQGKLADAGALYRRSLEISLKVLGPDHPDVATCLNNLATLYVDQGDVKQAEPLLKRSLEIREKVLGPDHPDVALSLNNLADLYRKQGKLSEAERLLKRSLEIKQKALGTNHPDAALALYNLGVVALERGQRSTALAYMRQAVPRFEGTSYWRALVEEDPDIASLRADPEFQKIVADVQKLAAAKEKPRR